MEVSNSFNRYDSTIQPNVDLQKNQRINKVNNEKEFLDAYRLDLSLRAKESKEFNDPDIKFPTHNQDILQYSENLNLTFKP